MKKKILVLVALVVLVIASVSIVIALISNRVITFNRSEEIAGGLSTGGWLVESDSHSAAHGGYLIFFKDRTMISNNLTMESMVPYDAISEDKIVLVVNTATVLAKAVTISRAEDGDLILSAPIHETPTKWDLHVRKVIEDTSTGDFKRELLGEWRVYTAVSYSIGSSVAIGDSGIIEFHRNGDVIRQMDRPPGIRSSVFEFPDFVRYGVIDDYLLLETRTGEASVFRIHSLGELIVLERGEKIPWMLVPTTR